MSEKRNFLVIIFITSIIQSCAIFSPKPEVSDFPEKSQLISSDIQLFYKAFDLAVKDTTNAKVIFKQIYFASGSLGLKDFYKSKIHSKEKFADFVIRHKNFYSSIRNNIADLSDLETEISKSFKKFETLYPEAVFPDIYFLIGRFSSNGTISKNGLLIGTEILSRTPNTNTKNWNKDILRISMERNHIPVTVAHELVHFNQNGMEKGNTLLWKSIREGSAEFIAEIISGQTDADFKDFEGQEIKIWNDFENDMDKSIWNSWQQASEKRPRNAGYWAGYIICKAYYEQIGNKSKAIDDILNIQDYNDFYNKSKVDEYVNETFTN
ncbi:DUF2268 domain-containing putative Zn-dependent protease [Marivirga sp.]|uniref:gliding motility protein GldB-related protein n=1 Tax=Marivirga sp. TaxID=2018662 RepID=UPI002D801336|nr:DUF2268 domain-containing putative Zn-dependent protease [Marivirga sp.]HET8860324.1 DUF2268 domain-containing putative Zn-dependent protease [Marivirga sp.]